MFSELLLACQLKKSGTIGIQGDCSGGYVTRTKKNVHFGHLEMTTNIC